MKACVLHNINDLRYEDVPDPFPEKGEVLLRIRAAGICGSDIPRVFSKGAYHFPTIIGHEFSGEILGVGDPADNHLIGKRAAVFPLLPCRKCDMCEIGEYASCRNYNYFGSRCDGGFAEYIAVPIWNLVFVDESVSFEEAAMAEPSAVSLHAVSRLNFAVSASVAIWGAGAIGLIMAKLAKIRGAGQVILIDIDSDKLDFARFLGFEHCVDSKASDYIDKIMDLTHGKGVDIAIEGAGASASLAGCLRCAKPQGQVLVMGNPAGDMHLAQSDYWEILRKQLHLTGSWNSDYSTRKNDWKTVINLIESEELNVKPLITHKFDLKDGVKAFKIMKDKSEFSNKIMFINK